MLDARGALPKLAMLAAVLATVAALPASPARAEATPIGPERALDGRSEIAAAKVIAATPAQEQTPAPAVQADGDGPDILKTALLTLAGMGSGAALFTLAYLIRRRIGFDLHLPPEDGGEEPGH